MRNQEQLYSTIKSVCMSEKSVNCEEKHNQYVFKVNTNANKLQIKKAVEHLFNVNVEMVRTINVKGKKKIFKQKIGKRKNWKKAYVTLKEGDEIKYNANVSE